MKIVVVRKDRKCMQCKTTIKQGTQCVTVSRPYKPREWICTSCMDKIQNIIHAKNLVNAVPFDDEGGYLAAVDNLHAAINDLYE